MSHQRLQSEPDSVLGGAQNVRVDRGIRTPLSQCSLESVLSGLGVDGTGMEKGEVETVWHS